MNANTCGQKRVHSNQINFFSERTTSAGKKRKLDKQQKQPEEKNQGTGEAGEKKPRNKKNKADNTSKGQSVNISKLILRRVKEELNDQDGDA